MCTGKYKCACYKFSGKAGKSTLDICDYCSYAKQFRKQRLKYRFLLGISLTLFLVITYVIWQ